jgi:hypothetical protein
MRRTFKQLDYRLIEVVKPKTEVKMKSDSWIGSLLWGRVGGALLVFIAFGLSLIGIEFSTEEQKQAFDAVQMAMAGVGVIMAFVSKWRESKKSQSGNASIGLILAVAGISLMVMMSGCANSGKLIDNSYKSLAIGKETYTSTMEILKTLDLSLDAKDKAVTWGTLYMLSHNTAVSSLLVYEASQSEEAKQALVVRMGEAATRLSDLLLYVHEEVSR